MNSKTVKFNIFQLLTVVGLLIAAYTAFPNIPNGLFVALSIIGMFVSQGLTFFTPSGVFVGHGQNWTVGKWIARIGGAVLGIMALLNESHWGVAAVSLLTPLVEIIVRVYGSDTPEQTAAANS